MVRHNALFKITECLSRCEMEDETGRICATYGEKRNVYKVLVRHSADRYILEDKDEDGKIILKRVLKK